MNLRLRIKKRNGDIEQWNYSRLVDSLQDSGIPAEAADSLVLLVEAWARTVCDNGIITSNEVREKIIDLLQQNFPEAVTVYKHKYT